MTESTILSEDPVALVTLSAGSIYKVGMMLAQVEQAIDFVEGVLTEGGHDPADYTSTLACINTQVRVAINLLDSAEVQHD